MSSKDNNKKDNNKKDNNKKDNKKKDNNKKDNNGKEISITLRVQKAKKRDIGRNIIRIDPKTMDYQQQINILNKTIQQMKKKYDYQNNEHLNKWRYLFERITDMQKEIDYLKNNNVQNTTSNTTRNNTVNINILNTADSMDLINGNALKGLIEFLNNHDITENDAHTIKNILNS